MMISPRVLIAALLLLLGWGSQPARAALQFDVFVGYEGHIHEANWFPVVIELYNDGPSFNAVIELTGGQFGSDQHRRIPVELPTNTRKRIAVPMFASGGRHTSNWDARLLTPNGKVIQERLSLPTTVVARESSIVGALPRNFGGKPVLPEVKGNRREVQPAVASFTVDQFPDSPISLEGLDAIYLNSEKAIDLRVEQVEALLGWVRTGGHLIVAAEAISEINSTPWLRQFIPMELTDAATVKIGPEFAEWIRGASTPEEETTAGSLKRLRSSTGESNPYSDVTLEPIAGGAETTVAVGQVKDGSTLASANGTPLMVQAPRGRGQITLLTFSPEREPFRSWKSRGFFWAKLAGIDGSMFVNEQNPVYGGWSVDGIFGALIDSRQIKKLPVTWLLLLLVVYLVVIGPFDQWWLKKIGKQMLTWITFPAYVVIFSLLIYFIGYKLRAGETEWNELNIVDVLPRGEKVDLRGHTYISIYSSSNARYPLSGQDGHATLRGELMDLYAGGREGSKARVVQQGNSFEAEVDVPVWTSLLYASDWFQTNDTPFTANIMDTGTDYQVTIRNLLSKALSNMRVVVDQTVFELETVGPGEQKTLRLNPSEGTPLRSFVQQNGSHFQQAAERRRNPLGDSGGGRLEDRALTTTVASFYSYLDEMTHNRRSFIGPAGLDLTEQAERGDALLFAFVPDFTLADDLNKFNPPRFKRDTVLRLTMPVRRPNRS